MRNIVNVLVILALLVVITVFGLLINPKVTLAIVLPTLIIIPSLWRWVCRKQGIPWFIWTQEEVGKDLGSGEEGKPIMMTRIVIFGLLEIRNVPPQFRWVLRDAFEANEETLVGFTEFANGWHCVLWPELLMMTVGMVDLRPLNLDIKKKEVNTTTNPVKIDVQFTFWVINATLFSIKVRERVVGIIEQIISGVLNEVTSGKSDLGLVDMRTDELAALSAEVTGLLNKGHLGGFEGLAEYGIKAEVRAQNIYPLEGVLDAQAGIVEAELDLKAAIYRAGALEKLRKGAGMPDESQWNIFLPIMDGFRGAFASGRSGVNFPKFTMDLGGVDSSSKKPEGKGKGEGQEGGGDDQESEPSKQ